MIIIRRRNRRSLMIAFLCYPVTQLRVESYRRRGISFMLIPSKQRIRLLQTQGQKNSSIQITSKSQWFLKIELVIDRQKLLLRVHRDKKMVARYQKSFLRAISTLNTKTTIIQDMVQLKVFIKTKFKTHYQMHQVRKI